jgi:hypothetical protein
MMSAATTRAILKPMVPGLIPLRPLDQQHRIVVKVDDLMASGTSWEQLTTTHTESRRLLEAVLA